MSAVITGLHCNPTIKKKKFCKAQTEVCETRTLTQVLRFSIADGVGDHFGGLVKSKYLVILINKHC